MFLNAASKFHFFNILNLNTIVIFAKQRGLGCQFQASIVCCKRFSFQLKIFNFQWSVYQLMRAAKNMGGVSFCARRCVLLFMLLKYTTAFYSPPSPSSLMYYISMHPMFSAHIGAWQALHCKSIEECGHYYGSAGGKWISLILFRYISMHF